MLDLNEPILAKECKPTAIRIIAITTRLRLGWQRNSSLIKPSKKCIIQGSYRADWIGNVYSTSGSSYHLIPFEFAKEVLIRIKLKIAIIRRRIEVVCETHLRHDAGHSRPLGNINSSG